MAVTIDINKERHLYWCCDRRRFITVCEDGNVVLDGMVMSIEEATCVLLGESGMQLSFFWKP